VSALHFRFRYFDISGAHFLSHPANFNGSTIAPGQTIHTNPDWYSGGLYYERRLRPRYEAYESSSPSLAATRAARRDRCSRELREPQNKCASRPPALATEHPKLNLCRPCDLRQRYFMGLKSPAPNLERRMHTRVGRETSVILQVPAAR
jgi:hypothetical protein